MLRSRKRVAAVASLAGLALAASACSSSSSPSGSGSSASAGTGVKGGVLKMLSDTDVDHMDTAAAYFTVSWSLMRTFTRQLVTYPNTADAKAANTPVADIAESLPTPTDGGLTYTFKIKQGVKWNTTPARQVTSQDFLLEFKRLCNPVSPSGAIGYYTGTIKGMADFCNGESALKMTGDGTKDNAADIATIKNYIAGHQISGIETPDASTITFHLLKPAGDFLNILALPFASAAPVEYLNHIPDGAEFRQNTISDGPYYLAAYTADKNVTLKRNPAYDQSTDTVRKNYIDEFDITEGADDSAIQQQLEAGTVDLALAETIVTADVSRLKAANSPNLVLNDTGSTNYMVMNLQSPNNNGALKNVLVRQALNYAVSKKNIIQVTGGPTLGAPLDTILTPGITGYEPPATPLYATPDHNGDPAKAKALLTQAGYPNGITLKYLYRNKGNGPKVEATVAQDLAKAGITIKPVPVNTSGQYYADNLEKPEAAKAGTWDIAFPGWFPDWQGNGARSFFIPLLDGRLYGPNSTNYGDYNNPAVNAIADQALAASDPAQVEKLWAQADQLTMKDAPWVPIYTNKNAAYVPNQVKGWVWFPFGENGDFTNIWLKR